MQIENLFNSFKDELKNDADIIAPLQLSGRIEEYFVTRFISHVYAETKGKVFGLTNLGCRDDKRKIDICLIEPKSGHTVAWTGRPKDSEIKTMLEVKYLPNVERLWVDASSIGNINSTLNCLYDQIDLHTESKHGTEHGYYPVNLKSTNKHRYGLIFSSYIYSKKEPISKTKEEFITAIENSSKDIGFETFHRGGPKLDKIYEDKKVLTYHASLYAGLWIRKN